MKNLWKYLIAVLIASNAYALDCVITSVKNSCWKDYEATITLRDVQTKQDITTFKIPKDQMWGRTTISCHPGQILDAKVSFSPDIWEGDGSKVYYSKRIWTLPGRAPGREFSWTLNMCFADDFSRMPEPIKSKGCFCDPKAAPPIEIKTVDINS
jgi:hypothetical protein